MVASKRGKNPANRWSRNRIPSKRADDQTLEQEMVALKNIGMSVLPVLITAVIAVGCNSPRPTISDLSAAGARLDATVSLMKGKWQGAAAHISFQDAFLSQSFILAIDHLSEDSLRFSLPGGYGKMNLTRKNNPKSIETF